MALPQFAPFDASSEVWDTYMERFECFLEANDFTDLSGSKKRAHFLNSCRPEVFATARALFTPTPVHTISWDILQLKLKDHYSPAPSRIARRFKLHQILQDEGESINHYVACLQTAALDCEYRNLDDALVEQLVCGVKDIRLQRLLLAKRNLDLPTAIEEAQAAEMSDRSTADIQKFYPPRGVTSSMVHLQDVVSDEITDDEAEIDRLQASKPRPKEKCWTKKPPPSGCLSCGKQHPRVTCCFRSATCRCCGRLGHIAHACRSLPKPAAVPRPRRSAKEECFSISRNCRISEVTALSRSPSNNKLSMTVNIEGASCQMEVDTGTTYF
ncbi:uncharacterized protein LOC117676961 [Pantherophis guttatus]|uniref:Uncharacterized protein LOC117676961 n=1 Tax=Pantherophis guttatus TaxID=94885 RepID=A0A6P9DN84_PANGU|nr:uncharacterized protein LOC117676961 [Pantherophis guttatus]